VKTILYILLAIAILVILFVLYVVIDTFYRLATGKISKDEQTRIIASVKKDRAKKKSKGFLHFMSYPSPLNNWGLWK